MSRSSVSGTSKHVPTPFGRSRAIANASSAPWPSRIIIALDIDSFYVACERILDPRLCGKPIGIQQKTILATCSYEARALGIGKLQNVKQAKEMCPELILVNGEDLTYYRRFSRAVTRLVKGIIWNRAVERLGMDELFCDVTDMVQAHLEDVKRGIGTPAAGCSSRIFFNLSQDRSSTTNGFWYEPMSAPSLVIPALVNLVASDSAASQREHAEAHSPLFGIAAHLAAHIRERIHTELGFTTSAGVAHNKTLAKLVASLNKPALQTTWDPEIMKYREEQETFLAGFEARKLQGMGHAICSTIQSHINTRLGKPEQPQPLTVAQIRSTCTSRDFEAWFGAKQASRLWSLLHGEDSEPVHPSPEYPLQISVEDSHYGITSYKEAIAALGALALHLLQRLREDLTEGIDENPLIAAAAARSGSVDYDDNVKGKGRASERVRWAQYPTTLRLTIRQGYDRQRETKSTSFPMDCIDEDTPIDVRADKMTQGILASLLKKLLKINTSSTGVAGSVPAVSCRITILNICATSFTTDRPSRTIAAALAGMRKPLVKAAPQEIDLTELASDEEQPDERGDLEPAVAVPVDPPIWIDLSGPEGSARPAQPRDVPVPHERIDLAALSDEAEDEGVVYVGEQRPTLVTCGECGARLFAFSARAHRAFHEQSGGATSKAVAAMPKAKRSDKVGNKQVKRSHSSGSTNDKRAPDGRAKRRKGGP